MTAASTSIGKATTRRDAWIACIVVTAVVAALVQALALSAPVLRPLFGLNGVHARACLSISCVAVAEIIALAGLWAYLRRRGDSFSDLGLWKPATWYGWVFGVVLGLATASFGLSNPALRLASPLGALLDLSPWHVYAAVVAGASAGFCEEIIFRGFVITELARAGHGRTVQTAASAVLFGCAHVGLLALGLLAGLAVILPTAVLGLVYALVYLASRRSLMPSIVSHFINDAAVIPLVTAAVVAMRLLH